MNRSKNARQRLPVARILFQIHHLAVQPVQVLVALQQEFANDLVAISLFLHLFRFGTRPNRLHPTPAALTIFFLSAHTIPFANARLPSFPVHLTFQHGSLPHSRFPTTLIFFSNSFVPASLLFSSMQVLIFIRASSALPPTHPLLCPPLYLSLFLFAVSLHSGTLFCHSSN